MTLGELMGPEAPLPAPWLQVPIAGLTADSRAVKPGYLFAALPGITHRRRALHRRRVGSAVPRPS